MSDFQKSFSESTSSIKFDEKYIDNSVQPNDIGVAEQWAVKTVTDPFVGNLATPVNSGYFTKLKFILFINFLKLLFFKTRRDIPIKKISTIAKKFNM